jgi:nitrate/nitrite transport system permease protein
MSAEAQFETVTPASKAKVFAFPARPVGRKINMKKMGVGVARAVVPPLLVIALILLVWQIACSTPGASLPPPTVVWEQAS